MDLSTSEGIAKNLKICAADLSRWNSVVYGQIPKKIQDKRNRLNALAMRENDEDLSLEINRLRGELNDLLDDEEMYWGQRVKAHWLKEGDKNTKFSMHRLRKGENRIPLWAFGMSRVDGVMMKKALPKLLYLTLTTYTVPPTQTGLWK